MPRAPLFGTIVFGGTLAALISGGFLYPQAGPSDPHDATVTASPAARIVAPPLNYSYPNGQTYVYGVEWRFFSAGTATIKMEFVDSQQRVTATADSSGFVNLFYKVRDRFEAHVDPGTFCSLQVTKHIEEGSLKRDTEIRFDYVQGKSLLEERNPKTGEQKHAQHKIPECVTDVITGFYYLASLPLLPGSTHTFPINDGGRTTQVTARVEAQERIKVPAGAYQTVRVQAEAIAGPMKGKGKVWVWFSDDASHIPVQMRSKLGWGTLTFRLKQVEKE